MKYYSTRTPRQLFDLHTAAKQGLAPDGGLFMPEHLPQVDMKTICELSELSFADTAAYLANLFFEEELSSEILNNICHDAYNFEVPLHRFNEQMATLELFHGPTLAFKDFGARFMARMFQHLFPDKKIVVLTATSGDTGSAVAAGFYGIDNINVCILYPKKRVSDFQERQMTTLGGNINAVCVDGSFDDCQALVKEIFNDHDFSEKYNVTSANSISLLRWIPQSFYYFYGYAQWKKLFGENMPVIAVPSGNFGNITAGIMAYKMGMPVKKFIACTNANDIIPRYLESGMFIPRESIATLSNAMDVGNPSNYERLRDLFNHSIDHMRTMIKGFRYSDTQTQNTIQEVYEKYDYIIDPHSAIGYAALQEAKEGAGFFLSTAHYSKFEQVVEPLLNIKVKYPDTVQHYFKRKKNYHSATNNANQIREIISGF